VFRILFDQRFLPIGWDEEGKSRFRLDHANGFGDDSPERLCDRYVIAHLLGQAIERQLLILAGDQIGCHRLQLIFELQHIADQRRIRPQAHLGRQSR
jgi:hypothetical protein